MIVHCIFVELDLVFQDEQELPLEPIHDNLLILAYARFVSADFERDHELFPRRRIEIAHQLSIVILQALELIEESLRINQELLRRFVKLKTVLAFPAIIQIKI